MCGLVLDGGRKVFVSLLSSLLKRAQQTSFPDVIPAVSVEALKIQRCVSWDFFAVNSAMGNSSQTRSQRGSFFLYLYIHGWFPLPPMSDCHSPNRHAKWNCLTAGGGSEIAGADLLHSGVWERASKIYGFWRTSVFLSFSYSYISQPRLADCWQLHDIFAVTWLESEASDKFLVWMSLRDVQWQIYFRYYKYVACPMVGDFGAILGVAWSDLLAFLVLLFHHPRKDGENDTFLTCCDGSFFFCDAGAWHRLVSFSLSLVKAVCWQEVLCRRESNVSSRCCWISWVLGVCHMNLHWKSWSVNSIFWEDAPPGKPIRYGRRDSAAQFCPHVTEQLKELNLQIFGMGVKL